MVAVGQDADEMVAAEVLTRRTRACMRAPMRCGCAGAGMRTQADTHAQVAPPRAACIHACMRLGPGVLVRTNTRAPLSRPTFGGPPGGLIRRAWAAKCPDLLVT